LPGCFRTCSVPQSAWCAAVLLQTAAATLGGALPKDLTSAVPRTLRPRPGFRTPTTKAVRVRTWKRRVKSGQQCSCSPPDDITEENGLSGWCPARTAPAKQLLPGITQPGRPVLPGPTAAQAGAPAHAATIVPADTRRHPANPCTLDLPRRHDPRGRGPAWPLSVPSRTPHADAVSVSDEKYARSPKYAGIRERARSSWDVRSRATGIGSRRPARRRVLGDAQNPGPTGQRVLWHCPADSPIHFPAAVPTASLGYAWPSRARSQTAEFSRCIPSSRTIWTELWHTGCLDQESAWPLAH